ncbi:MAG: DUF2085 domain-containing protein [Dehalococcoidia bacterium]|nr:DUF2085 domain-containing protein [Dehalococcoidia bacterium]
MDDTIGGLKNIAPWRTTFNRMTFVGINGLVNLVAYHWLALANLASFVFVFFAVLAPILMASGLALPARAIYLVYRAFCHQLPYRSYFISGYQVAFCERNTAIYGSMFVAGLAFTLVRDRLKPIDWRLFLALIAPMAIDGFTQLFGLRESNWQLRTVTGALFGIGTIGLMYPYVEIGMKDVIETMKGSVHSLKMEAGDETFRNVG